MKPVTCYLFVYGSLRRGFHHPAYQYISRYFDFAGDGKVKGLLYDLGEYPAAIPHHDDTFITGELYRIKKEDEFSWAIGQLDDYEGIDPEEGEKALYRRDLVNVISGNDATQAWIYWYTGDVSGKPLVESGDVLQYMMEKNSNR